VREALGFLMTREVSHQQSFEKALYSIQPSFPPGKLQPMKEFSNVYFNMSTGDGDTRGPWNNEPTFKFREAQPAVDGGDGLPVVKVTPEEETLLTQMAARLKSDTSQDPVTGAMLGADGNNIGAEARKGPQPTRKGAPPRH
jgi:Mn-containing catalase